MTMQDQQQPSMSEWLADRQESMQQEQDEWAKSGGRESLKAILRWLESEEGPATLARLHANDPDLTELSLRNKGPGRQSARAPTSWPTRRAQIPGP